MDKNGSHFWNQRNKSDSITHIFEKSSENFFQNAEWCYHSGNEQQYISYMSLRRQYIIKLQVKYLSAVRLMDYYESWDLRDKNAGLQ
jgi:hypothetical protein